VLEFDLTTLANMEAFTGLLDAFGINGEFEFPHFF
jgi:hypothetical protein